MSRIRSRIVALILATYVVGAASYMWAFWRNGLLGVLLLTGAAGYLLFVYWAIALTVGPFGCIQLWRARRAGQAAGIIVVGCGLALDVALYLLADAGQWFAELPSVVVKVVILLLLVFAPRGAPEDVAKATAA